jgi:hypothetical protein
MLMGIKDFLAPTRGRILLFIIIFMMVFLYDTAFAPFPGSPVVENLATQEGASSFVLYILVLPYILSCLIPAFFGLRKRKFLRLSSLMEFMHPRHGFEAQKPARQQQFVFPMGTEVVESKLPSQIVAQSPSQPGTAVQDADAPGKESAVAGKAVSRKPAQKKPAAAAKPKTPARKAKK